MEAAVKELRDSRKLNLEVLSKKWQEALERIDSLNKGDVYVNGQAEELKEYCKVVKDQVKVKADEESESGQDDE